MTGRTTVMTKQEVEELLKDMEEAEVERRSRSAVGGGKKGARQGLWSAPIAAVFRGASATGVAS
jgi:hypothetical protein